MRSYHVKAKARMQARTQGGVRGVRSNPLFIKILINAHTVNFDFDARSHCNGKKES